MAIGSPEPQLERVLAALSDPTRRALFEVILAAPGVSTGELADATSGMTRWGVMKHLGVLREAGLIQTMTSGRWRRHYPQPAALAPLHSWLDSIQSASSPA